MLACNHCVGQAWEGVARKPNFRHKAKYMYNSYYLLNRVGIIQMLNIKISARMISKLQSTLDKWSYSSLIKSCVSLPFGLFSSFSFVPISSLPLSSRDTHMALENFNLKLLKIWTLRYVRNTYCTNKDNTKWCTIYTCVYIMFSYDVNFQADW